MRREFDDSKWSQIIKYIEEHPNDYEVVEYNFIPAEVKRMGRDPDLH